MEIESMLIMSRKTSSTATRKVQWESQIEAWVSSRNMASKGSNSRRDSDLVVKGVVPSENRFMSSTKKAIVFSFSATTAPADKIRVSPDETVGKDVNGMISYHDIINKLLIIDNPRYYPWTGTYFFLGKSATSSFVKHTSSSHYRILGTQLTRLPLTSKCHTKRPA